MADIKQDLYGLEYSDSFSLQGIQEARKIAAGKAFFHVKKVF